MNKKKRNKEIIKQLEWALFTIETKSNAQAIVSIENRIQEIKPFKRLSPLDIAKTNGTLDENTGFYHLPNNVWFEPVDVDTPTTAKGLYHGWANAKYYDMYQKTLDPKWIKLSWIHRNWTTVTIGGNKLSDNRIEKNKTRKTLFKLCTEDELLEYAVDTCPYYKMKLDYIAGANPRSNRSKSIGLFHTASLSESLQPSTDRKDDGFYTKDNTQIISNTANKLKEECRSTGQVFIDIIQKQTQNK
jgi:hypothetical protein